MQVSATTGAPLETGADTIVVGLFAGKGIPHDVPDGTLQALVDSGEAKSRFRALAVAHAEGRRWILVGLGEREQFDAERARVAAAVAVGRARELSARRLCWELPHKVGDDVPGALVEGTLMAAYRFDAFKGAKRDDEGDSAPGLDELVVSAHHDVAAAVERAAVVAEAVNAMRDLQNTPANHMTPSALGHRALELASRFDSVSVEVEGREEILERGMGAFAAVAQGSYEEPALITLRYSGAGAGGAPALGLVGKAVTFDSGGLSIKPAKGMEGMKFDMSGGAAVIEAIGAMAALELPINVVGVVGATENMPSGRSVRPGDVVTAMSGTTIQVDNTDAEGRMVLADCLAHAVELGCERLVDLATLTGAIEVALGTTYAGLLSNDDALAATLEDAGRATGDLVWRLPLHPEYAEMIKGQYADIVNTTPHRKAGSITAAHFLERFVGGRPWAHLDIAGAADDAGRPYAPKGGSGFGVRLLVELARRLSSDAR
ncbi:MAG TPA: leucyl aminopeptidase [Solirubrobacteraceae bacterium]|jgi:leucyl aminopeptidase|nr:leucyl aminopeptidase [Solirubrobacteraceae bacterium]